MELKEYLVPSGDSETEFTEKRSRFIGRLWLVETEEDALSHIKQMRDKHWDATHNVYAYIIHGGATRYSDDGEPQGTAGMPVLDVLRKQELSNVLCVVTRYFGGILLGGGGLVRAYTHSAKLAVDAAGISCKRVWQKIGVSCPYNLFERLRQELDAWGGVCESIDYGAQVELSAMLPQSKLEDFAVRVTDISAGRLEIRREGSEYRAFPLDK